MHPIIAYKKASFSTNFSTQQIQTKGYIITAFWSLDNLHLLETFKHKDHSTNLLSMSNQPSFYWARSSGITLKNQPISTA